MSYNIICGDSKEKLKEIEDNSIDMIATDPQYGIGFMNMAWDKSLPDKEIWQECLRVLKPGASAMIMSGARLDCLWRICADLENSGFELNQTSFFWSYKSGFPKGQDMSKRADKLGCQDLAKELDGIFSKGKIKPSWEIIIWARKPTISTDYENQIEYGVGGVNCGKCMIPFNDKKDEETLFKSIERYSGCITTDNNLLGGNYHIKPTKDSSGRFPANTLCTDNSLGNNSKYFDVDKWAEKNNIKEDEDWFNALESGVIQIPKASKKEKNEGCLEEKSIMGGAKKGAGLSMVCDKCQLKHCDCENNSWIQPDKYKNNHPTCKPVKLFSYLIALMVPNDNCIVLDPFCGSGTTGVAAIKNNQNFIGIDLSEEYCEIAKARCENEVKKNENIIT